MLQTRWRDNDTVFRPEEWRIEGLLKVAIPSQRSLRTGHLYRVVTDKIRFTLEHWKVLLLILFVALLMDDVSGVYI